MLFAIMPSVKHVQTSRAFDMYFNWPLIDNKYNDKNVSCFLLIPSQSRIFNWSTSLGFHSIHTIIICCHFKATTRSHTFYLYRQSIHLLLPLLTSKHLYLHEIISQPIDYINSILAIIYSLCDRIFGKPFSQGDTILYE